MSYFLTLGNQQEGRLGPSAVPLVLTTLVTFAEPLRLLGVTLTNASASARTYTGHLVPPSGTASDDNQLVPAVNIPPNDSLTLNFGSFGIPLNGGGAPPACDVWQHVASGAGLNVTLVVTRRSR